MFSISSPHKFYQILLRRVLPDPEARLFMIVVTACTHSSVVSRLLRLLALSQLMRMRYMIKELR